METVSTVNIGILVFREGLECILVLAAIMASLVGPSSRYRRPILMGAAVAFLGTVVTWMIAVHVIDDLTASVPALEIQAVTGLLAVCVLLVVMNWFFHRVYWTGWISLHTERRRRLIAAGTRDRRTRRRLWLGLSLLGFTSLYREGVEVVLFLQSYRLRLGPTAVVPGLYLGLALTALVAALTFVAHRRLPYRRMLVVTGVLLGAVLLVMVGEQAQEMQLVHWLPNTRIHWLARHTPAWMGLWFSVFPTIETLAAQALAAVFVVGSYVAARRHLVRAPKLGVA
jgi:high-affinity iron transporter